MLRWAVGVLVLGLGVASPVFAQGQGKAYGRDGQAREDRGPVERIADEAVDAVVDELVGEETTPSGGMPPGLSKKGKMPPGLAKQGKTPPGWEKGKKAGWEKSEASAEKKKSWVRRLIGGLFGGKLSLGRGSAE